MYAEAEDATAAAPGHRYKIATDDARFVEFLATRPRTECELAVSTTIEMLSHALAHGAEDELGETASALGS